MDPDGLKTRCSIICGPDAYLIRISDNSPPNGGGTTMDLETELDYVMSESIWPNRWDAWLSTEGRREASSFKSPLNFTY